MKNIFLLPAALLSLAACTTSTQTGEAGWDKSYGGADKSYDTDLLELREIMAPEFETLSFYDGETGRTMEYNLYVPEDYSEGDEYPLVMFMADGSTVAKGPEAPLKQGYGGFIWALPESQAANRSFVLVPSFEGPENVVNDNWEVSEEADIALRLLHTVVAEYGIDENRLYVTGQSMGGMISFYLNANYPDVFAASMFVGSQWDIEVLEPLVDMNFLYIVSEGDPKASKGMDEVGLLLDENEVSYGTVKFAADLPLEEQNSLSQKLLNQGYGINFIEFDAGTVAPEGVQGGEGFIEHMYSFDHAYQLDAAREWMFEQSK